MPEVKGVRHARSEAFEARTKAKRLARQAQKSPGNVELQRQADEAWVAADALSEVAGVAYFDRHGVRRHAETDHTFMVTLVLQAYAARKGLVYDRRTE